MKLTTAEGAGNPDRGILMQQAFCFSPVLLTKDNRQPAMAMLTMLTAPYWGRAAADLTLSGSWDSTSFFSRRRRNGRSTLCRRRIISNVSSWFSSTCTIHTVTVHAAHHGHTHLLEHASFPGMDSSLLSGGLCNLRRESRRNAAFPDPYYMQCACWLDNLGEKAPTHLCHHCM